MYTASLSTKTTTVDYNSSSDDDDDLFFDAPDHFSDDDYDDDDEQAPEDDVSNLIINFKAVSVWNNSEENQVEYILPPNFSK